VIFRAVIRPKPGILDPQGQATQVSLRKLGFDVREVTIGRVVHVELPVADADEGRRQVARMCAELLANPLIEVYEVEEADA
jgi:phosphoribosylformylglycinamidine synthase subunit PurS